MSQYAERIVAIYERHASAWDAKRHRPDAQMERGWLERFTTLVPAGGTVLDIGCGAGTPIAAHLIAAGYDVTGVDSAPAMIALCRERFPRQSWHIADMRSLALGRAFNGLIAWDSVFHLTAEDQRGMFPVFRAHAAPGAPLLFTTGPRHGEAIGSFEGEPLYHASLGPAEYRALLAESGFSLVGHVAEDPSCGGHTVWLAQCAKDR